MKRLIFIFAIIFLISSTSCNKFLDVTPEGEILAEDAIKTPADMQFLLNGCYDVMRDGGFLGGMIRGISELMADNINGINVSGDYNEYYLRNFTIFNGTTRTLWKKTYETIYRTNVVLQNLDVIELTESEKNRIKGEALFIRAICHFEIVRLFAHPYGYTTDNSHLGIPLRLKPSKEPLARSTVQEVYNQIISDLKEAVDLIPLQNGIYATSWSAKGYLAKVYFQMNNFTEAFNYANDVITNGGFTFDPNIMGRFTANGTSEAVFALMSTGTQNNSGAKIAELFNSATRPVLLISDDLYTAATANPDDERGKKWYINDKTKTNGEAWSIRYNNLPYFRVPLVHLTELMLIRAEAGAQLGNTIVATDDLNKIRDRAYGVGKNPVTNGTSASQLIQIARQERRLELATEGNRLHDLKRIGALENNNLQIRGKVWNCNDMILQFTDSEISANPVLVQNPKGGC